MMEKMNEMLNLLEYTDLTEDMKMIADNYGMEMVKNLLKIFDGLDIHFPKVNNIYPLMKKYCKTRMNDNPKIISRDTERSLEAIQDIMKRIKNEMKES
jgi:hypothetical protein